MTPTSFLDQRPRSPLGLGTVILLHAGVIAAVLSIKGPVIERIMPGPPITIDTIEVPPPPPLPEPDRPIEQQRSFTDNPITIIRPPVPALPSPPSPPGPVDLTNGRDIAPPVRDVVPPVPPPPAPVPAPPPVRTLPEFDPRYAADQQPDYPASEQRAEREGTVRLRVSINAAGRVTAVSRLSATSDAFWRATERHALARWRFRPATEDGRPVASTKVMAVFFRLND